MVWHARNNFRRAWSRLALALLGAGVLLGVSAILLLGAVFSKPPPHKISSITGHAKWAVDAEQSLKSHVAEPLVMKADLFMAEPSLLKPKAITGSQRSSKILHPPYVDNEEDILKPKIQTTKRLQNYQKPGANIEKLDKSKVRHYLADSEKNSASCFSPDCSKSNLSENNLLNSKIHVSKSGGTETARFQNSNNTNLIDLAKRDFPRKMTRKVFSAERQGDVDPATSLYAAVKQFASGPPEHYDLLFPELSLESVSNIDLSHIGELNLLYFDDDGRKNETSVDESLRSGSSDGIRSVRTDNKSLMTLADLHMAFQPIVSKDERLLTLFVFQTFIRACRQFNVKYFLYGGSLLGAFRHHDVIPWDDDIDVIIPATQRPVLKEALRSVAGFALWAPKGVQWKFYWRGSPALRFKPFRWPYVDIFFYTTNATHMRDDHPDYQGDFRFRLTDVFPLQLRPFAGALLPVPCNMAGVLKVNYFPGLCMRSHYVHKLESETPRHLRARVACRELYPLYPFVRRRTVDASMVETLFKGNTTLSETRLPPFCSGK